MEYTVGAVVLDGWQIVRQIGEGAVGKVFEIQKKIDNYGLTARSALKVIRIPRSSSDIRAILNEGMDEKSVSSYFQGLVEEIVHEIAIMSTLKGHPNIATYEDHQIVEYPGEICWDILIRMELLIPLIDYRRHHEMPPKEVLRLGKEVCGALAYCQRKGLIHRDIKPGNLFISEVGQYKLGDFGVARTAEKTSGNMSKKGTEQYMAPEIYLGQPYGSSVDLYSLGLVLYQYMNGGRLPFLPPFPRAISYSEREKAMARRIKGDVFPPPAYAGADFAQVILKACAFSSKDRYRSAAEMLGALEEVRLEDASVPGSNGGFRENGKMAEKGSFPHPEEAAGDDADDTERWPDGSAPGDEGGAFGRKETGTPDGGAWNSDEKTIGLDFSKCGQDGNRCGRVVVLDMGTASLRAIGLDCRNGAHIYLGPALPFMIGFNRAGNAVFGEGARALARTEWGRAFSLIGCLRSMQDIYLDGSRYGTEFLLTLYLANWRTQMEKRLDVPVYVTAAAVPCDLNQAQKDIIRRACAAAGIGDEKLRLFHRVGAAACYCAHIGKLTSGYALVCSMDMAAMETEAVEISGGRITVRSVDCAYQPGDRFRCLKETEARVNRPFSAMNQVFLTGEAVGFGDMKNQIGAIVRRYVFDSPGFQPEDAAVEGAALLAACMMGLPGAFDVHLTDRSFLTVGLVDAGGNVLASIRANTALPAAVYTDIRADRYSPNDRFWLTEGIYMDPSRNPRIREVNTGRNFGAGLTPIRVQLQISAEGIVSAAFES